VADAALGIDIGATKVAVAAVYGDGRIDRRTQLPTAEATLAGMAELGRLVADGHDVAGVGVGICELVDLDGRIRSHSSIGWTEDELADALGALGPVRLDADVFAAALAEARVGAGRGFSSFVYATVGTGISHCLVLGGDPYRGAHGCAQLIGSAPLTFSCPHCGLRVRLALEDVASGAALARSGSAAEEVADELGAYLALLVNVLDPEALVVGGGLGVAGGPFWEALVRGVRAHVWAEHVRDVPVLPAGLGADSGVIGAGLVGLHAASTQEVR
jgi:glucokinase